MLHVANFAVGQSKPVDVSDSSAHDFRLHRSETHLNQRNASSERPPWRPNGEVEGPDDHARQAPRAHNLSRDPRRQSDHASRPPPTIVSTLARQAPPSKSPTEIGTPRIGKGQDSKSRIQT